MFSKTWAPPKRPQQLTIEAKLRPSWRCDDRDVKWAKHLGQATRDEATSGYEGALKMDGDTWIGVFTGDNSMGSFFFIFFFALVFFSFPFFLVFFFFLWFCFFPLFSPGKSLPPCRHGASSTPRRLSSAFQIQTRHHQKLQNMPLSTPTDAHNGEARRPAAEKRYLAQSRTIEDKRIAS